MAKKNWINSQRLSSLRHQFGWTQEDLARRSGLSVRVIAKAEAGQNVSLTTLDAIGTTFRMAGCDVQAADLTTNIEHLARTFIENYVRHQGNCVEVSKDFLSPDIVAFVDGDPATNPIAGTYRGIEEFAGLWRKFFSIFVRDGGSLGDNPQIRVIDNEAFAWGYENIRVPNAASSQPGGFVAVRMRFNHGLMTYFEDHYEAYGMMRQLEEWAREFPDAEWLNCLDREALLRGDYLRPPGTIDDCG